MADRTRIDLVAPGEERDRIVVAPSQGYVTGEDNLRISSFNSLSGVVLTISGRFFDTQSRQIVPFARTHTPNTDRTLNQTVEKLGTGYLLNVMVRATTGSPLTGQTFVLVEIVRGQSTSGDVLGVIGGDYVTARQGIAWPGSPVRNSTDGEGAARVIAGATPAAGAEISETVPTGARWELVAFRARLTTSATVISRTPSLTFDDGATVYHAAGQSLAQPASGTYDYNWGQSDALVGVAALAQQSAPIPLRNSLLAGHRIRTSTYNIQVGDQYTNVQYLVREFLEAA